MSLAFPSWLLTLIFLVFAAGVAYIVKLIFDNEKSKEQQKLDKQRKRDEKQVKKAGSTKRAGSRKAD